MPVGKRWNKDKTKFTWKYTIDLPSTEFTAGGQPKRKQESISGFATEKEAKKAERDRLNEIESGRIIINGNSTFLQVVNMFLNYVKESPDYAKGTYKNYDGYNKNHLVPFHNIKIKNISSLYIENWVIEMQKAQKSPYIINGCRKFAIAAFNYAKKHRLITHNPFEQLEKTDEPKVLRHRLSIEEIKKMHKVCEQELPDFYCVFTLAIFTGMRLGEYSAIEKEVIDFKKSQIWVHKQYTNRELKDRNKTRESTRIVDFSPTIGGIIKWHIKKYSIFSGLLFRGKDGKPISANWANKRFNELLKLCGYAENYIRLHDLRGQFVDIMHTLGMPDVYISRQVGHARTSTTNDIYSYIMGEVKTNAHAQLEQKVFT